MIELSVVVLSCDSYRDVWRLFFALFRRYWPDCPYPVYLGANQIRLNEDGIHMLLAGEDRSWSESARRMVEQVPSPYVLLLLEDFLLRRPVNSSRIEECLQALVALGGGYLRLKPFPKPDVPVPGHAGLGAIEREAPYRASLQAAIWRRDVFLGLLRDGESAWDFEARGSWRSNRLEAGFFCTWEPVLTHFAGVTLGKWNRKGVQICESEGVVRDCRARPVMNRAEQLRLAWRQTVSAAFDAVPWKVRRRVGNALRCVGLLERLAYRAPDYRDVA